MAERYPLISVVVVNYNQMEFTRSCISSILENTTYPNYEVIVVDSGSSYQNLLELRHVFRNESKVKLIDVGTDVGYSAACNIGFSISRGEMIALLNNDTIVTSDWLMNLFRLIVSDGEIACVQSKLVLMDHPERIDSVGHVVDPVGFLRAEGYMEIDRGQYDRIREICVVQPAACLIKSAILKEVGLFDPDYFWCHEDTDLSMRIRLRGYKILLAPNSVVHHKRSPTVSRMDPAVLAYYSRRNMLMTILKTYEARNLLTLGLVHILSVLVIGLWQLSRKRYDHLGAILKAIWWNVKNFRRTFMKRTIVQNMRRVRDEELFENFDSFNLYRLIAKRHDYPLALTHLRRAL